jgi:hypothetical protein
MSCLTCAGLMPYRMLVSPVDHSLVDLIEMDVKEKPKPGIKG